MKKYICMAMLAAVLGSCNQNYPEAPYVGVTPSVDPETSDVNADVSVTVDMQSDMGKISNMLTGVNLLYSLEKDALWKDDPEQKMVGYLKKMKSGILRFPGGKIVEFWHWDKPNGQTSMDTWAPGYDVANNKPDSEFMSLDEYMDVVKETNAEPLVGINTSSGRIYKRVDESVDAAKRLVQYCLDNNYNVKYYYISNEPYHGGARQKLSALDYAKEVNLYAEAIRSVDPNAKIVANWDRDVTSNSMKQLLVAAGKNIDVMEVHWYWNQGRASWLSWTKQLPLTAANQWYTKGKSHFEEAKKFRDFAATLGCGHIQLGSMEWNVGNSDNISTQPDSYQMAMIQGEMLMQFMEAKLCMASFWAMHYRNSGALECRHMLDENYNPRYTIDVMAMLGALQGGIMLKTANSIKEVYSVVSKSDDGSLRVALLNKNIALRKCALNFGQDLTDKNINVQSFYKGAKEGEGIVDSDYTEYTSSNGYWVVDLPPYSITVVTIK